MRHRTRISRSASWLLGGVLSGVCAPQTIATTIGEATIVERTISAIGKAQRTLEQGSAAEANEMIATDGKGRGAFRFVDDTMLSVGPNSSIKLDRSSSTVRGPRSPS